MSSRPAADPRRPWSIALRLTVWYAAAGFALVLVATGYLYWALVRNLDREDDQFLADKAAEVRRALDDPAALRQVVPAGGDREAGRLFVRVAPGTVETPGMAQVLPPEVFPRVGAGGPAEWTGEYRAVDGRWFRLRASTLPDRPYVIQVAMDTSHDDELLEDYRRQLSYVLGLSLFAVA